MISYLGVPSYENSTYLSKYKGVPLVADPMSGTTMGFLMLMSTLQYQAPYMSPQYSGAAGQAGKAAFIQSGGQAVQDKIVSKASHEAESFAKDAYHSVGITDTEVGVLLGSAKIIRDRKVDVNGPKFTIVKEIHTHITVTPDQATLGLKLDF